MLEGNKKSPLLVFHPFPRLCGGKRLGHRFLTRKGRLNYSEPYEQVYFLTENSPCEGEHRLDFR
jgi:hypothetical protein